MISFTQITPHDFKLVFKLAKEIWQKTYSTIISQKQMDYMLDMMYKPSRLQADLNDGFKWELIHHKNILVGYLAYVIKDDNRVFLSKIYLKSAAQGQGIGKIAINRVKKYAKTHKSKAVYLTVNKENMKGIRAYKNAGFKIIDKVIADIGMGYVMDDYIFEYSIQD